MRPTKLHLAAAFSSLALVGCAAGPPALDAGDHDRPVPPGEPRAELGLEVDLEPARDCEERFDLELYQDRAVDLIAWDERKGRCIDRQVSVRYLSKQISAEQLLERVRELARDVKRLPAAATPKQAPAKPAPSTPEPPAAPDQEPESPKAPTSQP